MSVMNASAPAPPPPPPPRRQLVGTQPPPPPPPPIAVTRMARSHGYDALENVPDDVNLQSCTGK